MAFDLGFNFRATAPFVTDGVESAPFLAENFPHTYTSANGYSLNAGQADGGMGSENDAGSNDPKIAGDVYFANGASSSRVRFDLASGSAPGAGTYTVDLAAGSAGFATNIALQILDNVSVVLDVTNGGAGYSTLTNHFRDASLADVNATTTWTGTTTSIAFASTTVYLKYSASNVSGYTAVAHFRLTLATAATAHFRRTLSELGTRIGTRQVVGAA
jgi:hypothetical protein